MSDNNDNTKNHCEEDKTENSLEKTRKKNMNSREQKDASNDRKETIVSDLGKNTASDQLGTNEAQGNIENNVDIKETETADHDVNGKALKRRLKKQRQKERKKLTKPEVQETTDTVESSTCTSNDCTTVATRLKEETEVSENVDASATLDTSEEERNDENEELKFTDDIPAFVAIALKKTGKSFVGAASQSQKSASAIRIEQSTNDNVEHSDEVNNEDFTYVKGKRSKQPIILPSSKALEAKTIRLILKNKFNYAIENLSQLIQQNPLCLNHYVNRSFCYLRSKQYSLAMVDAQHVIQHSADMEVLVKAKYIAACCLYSMKNYADAEETLAECVSMSPNNAYFQKELLRIRVTQLMELGFHEKDAIYAAASCNTTLRAIETLMEESSENKKKNNVYNEIDINDQSKMYYLDDAEANWHSLLLLTL